MQNACTTYIRIPLSRTYAHMRNTCTTYIRSRHRAQCFGSGGSPSFFFWYCNGFADLDIANSVIDRIGALPIARIVQGDVIGAIGSQQQQQCEGKSTEESSNIGAWRIPANGVHRRTAQCLNPGERSPPTHGESRRTEFTSRRADCSQTIASVAFGTAVAAAALSKAAAAIGINPQSISFRIQHHSLAGVASFERDGGRFTSRRTRWADCS